MDESLKHIIDLASARGNQYIKGEVESPLMPVKMAELAVFLLEKAGRLPGLEGRQMREELIEIQNKIDDMRRALFVVKGHVKRG